MEEARCRLFRAFIFKALYDSFAELVDLVVARTQAASSSEKPKVFEEPAFEEPTTITTTTTATRIPEQNSIEDVYNREQQYLGKHNIIVPPCTESHTSNMVYECFYPRTLNR